jgi:hypothetical protein
MIRKLFIPILVSGTQAQFDFGSWRSWGASTPENDTQIESTGQVEPALIDEQLQREKVEEPETAVEKILRQK